MEFNYLVERTRMLNSLGRTYGKCAGVICQNCPLDLQNKFKCTCTTCTDFEVNHPLEATEIVRKWAEEHPQKTRKDILLEKFPKAEICKDGSARSCCAELGMIPEEQCNENCMECWDTEVE